MNPCRIVVVEDEAIVAMDIEERLTAMGYEPAGRAAGGEQALELVEQRHPDLVLMDIRLQGDMDGIAAAEEIRRRFHLPVIFLTAYSENDTLDRVKLTEPFGYILKPFDDRELKSAIEIAIYKHQAEKEILRLNRLYDVLSQINQTVVRTRSRDELFPTVCRLVVERGAIDLAWIGWLDPMTSRINTVAAFGTGAGFLTEAKFHSDDRSESLSNPGKAIREGKPAICNECAGTECFCSSVNSSVRLSFQSCGSFPILFEGRICGVLNLCVKEPGFFREREIELLQEVALDVSFALDKFEAETRRTQAESALQENEKLLRLFIEHAPAALAMFDREMRYLSVSRRWLSDYNLGERDVTGLSHYEVFPKIPERWKAIHRRALSGEVVRTESDHFKSTDGTIHWLHWEVRPWRDQTGGIAGIVIFSENITERKKAEESLRKSEERFRQAMEAASDGIWDWDLTDNSVYYSPGYFRMLGYEPEEFPARAETWRDLIHPADRERALAANDICIRNESPSVNVEFRMRARDGTWRWILGRGKALRRDTDGRALQMIGTHADITERKLAESLLQIRLNLLEFATSHSLNELLQKTMDEICALTDSPIGFYHFVESDQKTLSRQSWSTRTTEEFCRLEAKEIHSCSDQAGVWADCLRQKKPVIHNDYSTLPHRRTTLPGHPAIVRDLILPVIRADRIVAVLGIGNKPSDYNDKDVEIVAFLADVAWEMASRKRVESALRESESRFRSYIDQAPLAVLVADEHGRFLDSNRAASDLLGYDADAFRNMSITDINPKEDRNAVLRDFETLVRDRRIETEHRLLRRDGHLIWALLNVVMLDGRISLAYCQDITQRKRNEEEKARTESQLRQAQKMEALGTLAGGIAHDFNNILGIIIGYTELAMPGTGEKSTKATGLQEVLNAANRAKDLVKQILAFSRLSDQEKKPVQVGLIVREVMKMLRASLPSTIGIEMNVASKAAMLCDPTQIHQVMLNLCTNAAHAMRDKGGLLEVSLTDTHLDSGTIPAHSELKPGPYLKLMVKDSGHGIDPSILERIFDPFFTTKEQGVGTGLGLSVVHGIVKNHDGTIEVESCPGKGTVFQVLLPALEGARLSKKAESFHLPRGNERILVVDDEPSLVHATKEMLERLGYKVECRTSGLEGLELFRFRLMEEPFDLVITDMTMPYLTGVDLARELLTLQPDLPVLLCTGFNEKIDTDKSHDLGFKGILMKPVAVSDLAGLIRKVLDARTGTKRNNNSG
jgi:PAS domain S-box-containing protein